MLGYVFDRLRQVRSLDGLILATSDHAGDDAVAEFAAVEAVQVFRGSLDDVAGRLLGAAEVAGADALLRISADSPLFDPAIAERAIAAYRAGGADLVSNVVRRTFPKGQSAEIIAMSTLRSAMPEFERPGDREHVTPFFYRHADRFRIVSLEHPAGLGDVQLSVDTQGDLDQVRRLVARMTRPHWTYGLDEVLALRTADLAEGVS